MPHSPRPAVDDAASAETRRNQRGTSARHSFNLMNEGDCFWLQLFEPFGLFVSRGQIVRECKSDIGGSIQKSRLTQEYPVELANATLPARRRSYLCSLQLLGIFP